MARIAFTEETKEVQFEDSELNDLVPSYYLNKQELDSYKKICDGQNIAIKEAMRSHDVTEFEAGGYVAKVTVTHKEDMNEDKLLEILRPYAFEGLIKTKEYIDMDVLEKAIYNGQISNDVLVLMDAAKETREVTQLRVSKAKKKKEDK